MEAAPSKRRAVQDYRSSPSECLAEVLAKRAGETNGLTF